MKTIDEIESVIRTIPDFPVKGIDFKDITTLLNNAQAYKVLIDHLYERYAKKEIDYIAGIESRGFIFGASLASRLNIGFVPVRKKGKLPYTTISEKYSLEYGFDEVEIHIDAFNNQKGAKVLLIDDLIATGGTAGAASSLISKIDVELVEACFIIELEELKGREKLTCDVYSVLKI